MNEPIETEQIFNDIGQKIGLKYRYTDGSTRKIIERTLQGDYSSKNTTQKKEVIKEFKLFSKKKKH